MLSHRKTSSVSLAYTNPGNFFFNSSTVFSKFRTPSCLATIWWLVPLVRSVRQGRSCDLERNYGSGCSRWHGLQAAHPNHDGACCRSRTEETQDPVP